MSDTSILPGDEPDLLAAEHVLGLLAGAEAIAAAARVGTDADFALRVAAWEARLMPMFDGANVEPPAMLWQRIDSQLPANDSGAPSVGRWQATAGIATAIAAALLIALLVRPGLVPAPVPQPIPQTRPQPEPQPALIATLAGEDGPAAMTVSYDRAADRLLINPVAIALEGRVPELWVIPADGTPRSLGVVRADGPSRVALAAERRAFLVAGSTLAISVEPPGGSPQEGPTGPVIMSGKISAI